MKRTSFVAVTASALALALSGAVYAAGEYKDDAGSAEKQSAIPSPDLSGSYRVSDLMDKEVKNARDEDLGSISELILDKDGKVSHVVLQEGGVLGMGENKYVVPWDRIQVTPDQDVAILEINKDQLSSEFAAFEEERKDTREQKDDVSTPQSERSPDASDSEMSR